MEPKVIKLPEWEPQPLSDPIGAFLWNNTPSGISEEAEFRAYYAAALTEAAAEGARAAREGREVRYEG